MARKDPSNHSLIARVASFCPKVAWYGWLTYLSIAFLCVVLLAEHVDYASKWIPPVAHGVLAVLALVLGVAAILVKRFLQSLSMRLPESKWGFIGTILALSLALFLLQLVMLRAAGFYTGWDVGILTTSIHDVSEFVDYFSIYPNQLFIEGVFRHIAALGERFGIVDSYRALVMCGMLNVTLATMLAAFCARSISDVPTGYATFFLMSFLWGLSPWVLVPYTDTYGILWPAAVLFFYLCVDRLEVKTAGMVFCSVIGYHIKPTIIFVIASIVFIELCHAVLEYSSGAVANAPSSAEHLASRSSEPKVTTGRAKIPVHQLLFCAVSIALALWTSTNIVNRVSQWDVELNPNRAYSVTHYLMMGVNDHGGVWSQEDLDISDSYDTVAERKAGNIAEWRRRLRELGAGGIVNLLMKKTLSNYADGSFSWAIEGGFFWGTYGTWGPVQRFF
ncbi:MAG: hypothetical protein IKE22_06260, partial [Atopobiaceae bacterium]|nr:hypothetical protein [Atopobiaceae bacterium]